MSIQLTLGPVARARNGVIGRDGDLPWRLASDMAHFKALTLGKPVIMGRKTWDSLPRDGSFEPTKAVRSEDFSEAVQMAREQAEEDGVGEVCVIGGAALFALALPNAGRLYLTEGEAD